MPDITEIWAYVAEDDEGEGITAFKGPDGAWMPMVGADEERMKSLRPMAFSIARTTGRPIKLVRFKQRTELETISP